MSERLFNTWNVIFLVCVWTVIGFSIGFSVGVYSSVSRHVIVEKADSFHPPIDDIVVRPNGRIVFVQWPYQERT